MINEDEKFSFNPEYLFPEAARRVKILQALRNSWGALFPADIARHSFPYNLGVNEISIDIDNRYVEDMLKASRGNVLRGLKKFGYEPNEKFEIKITFRERIQPRQPKPVSKKNQSHEIKITDEELAAKMQGAPKTLSEDINRAISHLKIFLEKYFPQK